MVEQIPNGTCAEAVERQRQIVEIASKAYPDTTAEERERAHELFDRQDDHIRSHGCGSR